MAVSPTPERGRPEGPATPRPAAARVAADAPSGPDHDPDVALLERARAGDAAGFRALFERHAAHVRRFLGDLLRDDSAADEATQETFVRAHRGLASLADQTRLRSWLFGIARNVFHERLRKVRRETSLDDDDGAQARLGHAPSPEELLLGREAEVVLRRVVGGLSPDRQAALLLRLDHELGYPEIAEVMGWTLPKVKNEIHRARLQMRAEVLSYLGGES